MVDEDKTVKRIQVLSAKLQKLQADVVVLSAEREALVRELRAAGWSHGRIAEASGLSRGRVAQIVA